MRKYLLGLILLTCSFTSFSQQIAKGLTAANGQFVGFYEYKPTDYNPNATKKYPLIIFLHGIGERGNGTTDLVKVSWHAIPRMIAAGNNMTYKNPKTGEMETFLVLSPQLSYNYGYWDFFYIEEMLKYAKQNLNVDQNRIYLTGLSAGGGGVWRFPNASLANAQQFAAIAPICGTCDWNINTMASTIVAAKLGVWAFHANDDYTVSVNCTNFAIDAINTMNPATPAKKTIYATGGHYIWEIAYGTPEIFEWFLGFSRGGAITNNAPPVAKAGNDVTINLPLTSVTLTSDGSYDSDGSITQYKWTQISGPSSAFIGTSGGASSLMSLLVAGSYTFRLTVTDNSGQTATDDVVINVNGLIGAQPPVANAGKDESIPVGQATVLHGQTSTAPSGSITAYSWKKVSGPAAFEIVSPNASETWIKNMTAGSYVYGLTVTDNNGNTGYDEVLITVGGTTTTPPPPGSTSAPVANAGKDETIPAGQATVLHGETSTATAGIKSYTWTKFSGPTPFEMLTPNANQSWIRNMVEGTYVYRLTVTDNNGVSASDDVVITVGSGTTPPATTPPATTIPVANAGKDESIPAGQATVLHGETSTATAGIKSYAWSKFSGPTQFEMLTPNANQTWIRNMVAGTYVYRLTVTDNNGGVATDDVVITVGGGTTTTAPGATGGSAPVANAGKDETIPTGQATVLHGETSTATAGVKSYTWTKFSGPAQFEMLTPNANQTWIRNMTAGTYVYRLTVTDNNNVSSSDDVIITVNAPLASIAASTSSARQLSAVSETSTAQTVAVTPVAKSVAPAITKLAAAPVSAPVVSFQNPVNNNLGLNWYADYVGSAKINILDLNGKLLKTMSVNKTQQTYQNTIQLNGLKQGVFVLQIQTDDGKTLTNKFVKK